MDLTAVRRRAVTRGIEALLTSTSAAARWHPQAKALGQGIERIANLPYRSGGDTAHLLDVYRPRGATDLPVMLYIHGGGFSLLSKDTHWMFGQGFARRGFVVVSINYRLAPRHPFPAAVIDACAALDWVLDNARAFGGDPTRLVYAGESAGANLSLALTIAGCWRRNEPWAAQVFDRHPKPLAVLPACGFLQVSDAARYLSNTDLHPVVRSRISAICKAYLPREQQGPGWHDLADPVLFLEGAGRPERPLPPMLAVCGDKDPVLADTLRLGEVIRQRDLAGGVCTYEGGIHAFHALFWRPLSQTCWKDQEDFLLEHVPGARRMSEAS